MREFGGAPPPEGLQKGEGEQVAVGAPQEEGKPISEYSVSYSIVSETGKQAWKKAEGKAVLEDKNLTILPKFGNILSFSYRDIVGIDAKNYKINLRLSTRETLVLSDLGYDYENFLRVLTRLRNEVLLKDLLMHEALKKSGVEADFVYTDENKKVQKGGGEVRLYETGLTVIPEKGEMFKIRYSDLAAISEQRLGITLVTDFGEKLTLSKMGTELDPFKKALSDINNEIQSRVFAAIREFAPGISSTSLMRVAQLMKEGKAAERKDIDAVDPTIWGKFESALGPLKESYDFLKDLSREGRICIGVKRGLMGGLTGEYVWFLIPIYDTDPKKLGNAIAMEATSGEEGSGKATYFFKIVSRKDYPKFKKLEELDKKVDEFVKTMNRCMLAINFRREPIYLPDEKLDEPKYLKYKFAVQKIPSLQTLRSLFTGRVIHSSPEQWKQDVMDLLKFNVGTLDDNAKWRKGENQNAQ